MNGNLTGKALIDGFTIMAQLLLSLTAKYKEFRKVYRPFIPFEVSSSQLLSYLGITLSKPVGSMDRTDLLQSERPTIQPMIKALTELNMADTNTATHMFLPDLPERQQ